MLKLYDRRCRSCGKIDRDVLAECADALREACECGGEKVWAPGVGGTDVKQPFYDPAFDRTFSSYRELESHAKREGKTVLTPTEHENLHEGRRKDDTALRESIHKSYYRLAHGYRDHPDPRR